MATWLETNAMDGVLSYIKDNAAHVWLLDNYIQGQDYATVEANKVGEAAVSDGDFTGPAPDGLNRKMNFNGKSGMASADSVVSNLHVAIVSGSEVLICTNETSNQAIYSGNPLTFSLFTITVNQPTQV